MAPRLTAAVRTFTGCFSSDIQGAGCPDYNSPHYDSFVSIFTNIWKLTICACGAVTEVTMAGYCLPSHRFKLCAFVEKINKDFF